MRLARLTLVLFVLSAHACGSDSDVCQDCLTQTAPDVWVASDEAAVRKLALCPMTAPELWSHSAVLSGDPPAISDAYPQAFDDGLQWTGTDLPCMRAAGVYTLQTSAGWRPTLAVFQGPDRSGSQVQADYSFDDLAGETQADLKISVLHDGTAVATHEQKGCVVQRFSFEPLQVLLRVSGRAAIDLHTISVEGSCPKGSWIGSFAFRAVAAAASFGGVP